MEVLLIIMENVLYYLKYFPKGIQLKFILLSNNFDYLQNLRF